MGNGDEIVILNIDIFSHILTGLFKEGDLSILSYGRETILYLLKDKKAES